MKRFITVFTTCSGIENFILQPKTHYLYQEYIENKLTTTEVSYRVVKKDLESEDICFLNLIDKEQMLFAGAIKNKELLLSTRKPIVTLIDGVMIYIKTCNAYMEQIVLAIKDKGYYIFNQEEDDEDEQEDDEDCDDEYLDDPQIMAYKGNVNYSYYEYDGKVYLMNINFLLGLRQYRETECRLRFFFHDNNLYYKDSKTVDLEEPFKIGALLRGMLFR